jgi:hypothetical protein
MSITHACPPLAFLWILQMLVITFTILAFLMAVAMAVFCRNWTTQFPQQQARVLHIIHPTTTMTSQQNPSGIPSRHHAYVELLPNDLEDIYKATSLSNAFSTEPAEPAQDIPSNTPLVALLSNVAVGDIITVSLLHGDANKPLYIPFQRHAARHYLCQFLGFFASCLGGLALIQVIFRGLPLVASASTLEDYFQKSKYCHFFLNDDNDNKDPAQCCHVTTPVAAAYYTLLAGIILLHVGTAFWVYRQTRLADTARANYQRVRNDETTGET